jgi:tRNA (adenine22-N1)-methyltransferase
MRHKRLPPRLEAAASFVPQGARLCDVGSDHARLPVALLRRGVIEHALLTDINPGPLERARLAVAKAGFLERVAFRLANGLAGVDPASVDCVTLTGLGGETIAAVLAHAPWAREKILVLQPMQGIEELRVFLGANGYAATAETLAREGARLYGIIAAAGGDMALTPGERAAGPARLLQGNPLWPAALERHIRRYEGELAALTVSAKHGDKARMGHTVQILNDLRRLHNENKR